MVFRLLGEDRLSRMFRGAGRSADDMRRQITRAGDDGNTSLAGLVRGADGRLRDLRGRFASAGRAARVMGDDIDGGARRGGLSLRGLAQAAGRAGSAAASALPSLGGGAGLAGALKGVGVAAAVSTLPALGALVPMLTGVAAAAAVAKLAFSGVGEAVSLAGEDQEEYAKALKKMGPEQRAFTKAVVSAKKEFSGLGREVQKIVLPTFTSALKQARPVIGIVKDGVKETAGAFAEFGTQFGKLFGSNQFQNALRTNFSLGAGFIRQLAQPLTQFTQSLLEFGAASKPTLDAFSKGIGDLLGKGLPGFFRGLQTGIKGSAQMFTGLFSALNKVLPAFGELVGAISNAVGPALREIFESAGTNAAGGFRTLAGAVRFLKPLFGEVGGAARIISIALQTVGRIAKNVGTVVLESLWPSFRKAENAVGPLQRLARWLKNNETAVREFSRKASNFIIDFVGTTIRALPDVIRGFRLMATGVFIAFGTIVTGAAKAFGWIPGIGDKLKRAEKDFNGFREAFIGGLTKAESKSRDFANKVGPRLKKNKLKMNIKNWRSQISKAERQLKNAPDEKKAKLKADIKNWKSRVSAAERQLKRAKSSKTAKLRGNIRDWNKKIAVATRKLKNAPSSKKARLKADISNLRRNVRAARRKIASVRGKTVGIGVRVTSNVSLAKSMALLQGRAEGGLIQGFPHGGLVHGPGTETSDSILARVSRGEFVVRAAAVRRFGVPFFQAVNSMRTTRAAASTAARSSAVSAGAAPTMVNIAVNGALDPVAVARQIQQILLRLKRDYGVNIDLKVG